MSDILSSEYKSPINDGNQQKANQNKQSFNANNAEAEEDGICQ